MPGRRDQFLERLYLALRDLTGARRRVILAVSGGADSMVLMHAATRLSGRLKATLHVVTVDHGLRRGSAAEARRVMADARALGLSAEARRLGLSAGAGMEERARLARYAALEVARRAGRFAWVATAHTATDQAETVLMRLARGSALGGARAILERRERVIRPLLFATREEVRAWAKVIGVSWHEDPMNEDRALLRTRVRLEVLPALEAATDRKVSLRLARFARLAADDDALLEAQAAAELVRLRRGGDGLDSSGVNGLPAPIARRVLAQWLRSRDLAVDGELIERMRYAIQVGGVTGLPRRQLLKCRRGKASIVIE